MQKAYKGVRVDVLREEIGFVGEREGRLCDVELRLVIVDGIEGISSDMKGKDSLKRSSF